jgi:hypothetical protein
VDKFKPIKVTYRYSQPYNIFSGWSNKDLNKLIDGITTDLILAGMDLQEKDIEKSDNRDAIRMLKEIGIES